MVHACRGATKSIIRYDNSFHTVSLTVYNMEGGKEGEIGFKPDYEPLELKIKHYKQLLKKPSIHHMCTICLILHKVNIALKLTNSLWGVTFNLYPYLNVFNHISRLK